MKKREKEGYTKHLIIKVRSLSLQSVSTTLLLLTVSFIIFCSRKGTFISLCGVHECNIRVRKRSENCKRCKFHWYFPQTFTLPLPKVRQSFKRYASRENIQRTIRRYRCYNLHYQRRRTLPNPFSPLLTLRRTNSSSPLLLSSRIPPRRSDWTDLKYTTRGTVISLSHQVIWVSNEGHLSPNATGPVDT